MWIKTDNDQIINLDKVSRFSISSTLGNISIVVNYDMAQWSTPLLVVASKEEAKLALEYIYKAIKNQVACIDSTMILSQIRSK